MRLYHIYVSCTGIGWNKLRSLLDVQHYISRMRVSFRSGKYKGGYNPILYLFAPKQMKKISNQRGFTTPVTPSTSITESGYKSLYHARLLKPCNCRSKKIGYLA